MHRLRTEWFALAFTLALAGSAVQAVELRFSGFGDFVLGGTGGAFADPAARTLFTTYGMGQDPVNTTRGFGLTGTDFVVIADMTPDMTFLGELNLQTGRGDMSSIDLDVERFFMNFDLGSNAGVQAGLYFTPIGYNNRFLYARAWLMNSIQVPDFFEEELGFVPTHTVGIAAHGSLPFDNGHRLQGTLSMGNGRARTPDGTIYARDLSTAKELTALVEWIVPGYKDSRIGLSGWTDAIETLRMDAMNGVADAATAERIALREVGLDPYLVLHRRRWSLNAEAVFSRQMDRRGDAPHYDFQGGLVEASLHVRGGRLHPYVRYDWTSVPEGGGPYLSLREGDGGLQRTYVPEFRAVMTGAAFDLNMHCRLKAEAIRHVDGPRRENGLAFQAAFGF